jgi:hypothetical protein
MRRSFTVHRKDGNAFFDALFHRPDNSAFRHEKTDRMPELQGAVSDGVMMIRNILFLTLVFLTACSEMPKEIAVIQQSPTPKRELKTDIPKDSWVKIYFQGIDESDTFGLDKFAKREGLSILRETVLPENDLEVRVWVGFGLYGIDGFILTRSSRNWSAVSLKQMICQAEKRGKTNLQTPKSGWENAWQKLVEVGILTLPDSSKLKYVNGVMDGTSYVVETNSDFLYRTYQYGNPNFEKLKEAKQMVKIGQIIADEFGLETFKTGGCGKDE